MESNRGTTHLEVVATLAEVAGLMREEAIRIGKIDGHWEIDLADSDAITVTDDDGSGRGRLVKLRLPLQPDPRTDS